MTEPRCKNCGNTIYYKKSTKHWYHEATATDVCEGIYTPEQEITPEAWKFAAPTSHHPTEPASTSR